MSGILYDIVLQPLEKAGLSRLRAKLLSRAHGRVLEIGAGTGLNFRHYPPGVDVTAIEPDPSNLRRALQRAGRFRVLEADAQKLPFGDAEFDTVVGTLVFCTIPDFEAALREVHRVLKPGGQFLLMEHIRRETPLAGWTQDLLTPAWKHIAGGCHLNRNPRPVLDQLGFKLAYERPLWRGFGEIWVFRKP